MAGGSRGPDVTCWLCFPLEVMVCGAKNVPVWVIIGSAPNAGFRDYCRVSG